MSLTRGEAEKWREQGASKARAFGEAGRKLKPYFGKGADAERREVYWSEGFELGLKQRAARA